jgi:hypothetical protein
LRVTGGRQRDHRRECGRTRGREELGAIHWNLPGVVAGRLLGAAAVTTPGCVG